MRSGVRGRYGIGDVISWNLKWLESGAAIEGYSSNATFSNTKNHRTSKLEKLMYSR
jgi:hypothetical protein